MPIGDAVARLAAGVWRDHGRQRRQRLEAALARPPRWPPAAPSRASAGTAARARRRADRLAVSSHRAHAPSRGSRSCDRCSAGRPADVPSPARRRGWRAAHAVSARQCGEDRVERGAAVERRAGRQRHVGRRDTVEHRAAHDRRMQAQQLECGAGAVARRRSGSTARHPAARRTASTSCIAGVVVKWRRPSSEPTCGRAASCSRQAASHSLRCSGASGAPSGARPAASQSSRAERPVPRWSMKTRSRRWFSRASSGSTDGATEIAL